MTRRKRITIEPDVEHAARMYVFEQLRVMERFGSRPQLSDEQLDELVYKCSLPAQEILNARRAKV